MSNAPSCSTWRLYVIVDGAACGGRDPAWVAEQAIRGGADVLQLRDKTASTAQLLRTAERLLTVARSAGIPLLINDRVDVALAVKADGVHLGQDDLPITAARTLLGPEGIIGKSTHSLQQALAADEEPIDYLALGPIYATPTKPDYDCVGPHLIPTVKSRTRHPLVAIGGIEEATLEEVVRAGAERVAVVRAVCVAADPAAAARNLKRRLAQFVRAASSAQL